MQISKKEWPLLSLCGIKPRIDTQPDYQRPAVWSLSQKQLLVDTILRSYDVPKIYWRQKETGQGHRFLRDDALRDEAPPRHPPTGHLVVMSARRRPDLTAGPLRLVWQPKSEDWQERASFALLLPPHRWVAASESKAVPVVS
jgi:hypothetical protein